MSQKMLVLILLFAASGLPGLSAKTHVRRPVRMEATAFSLWKRPTSSGTAPHEGVAAADPSFLPLGSVIAVSGAGPYSGRYIVTDTGAKISGRRIDLFIASRAQAKRFGRRMVTVRVLHTGSGKQDAQEKDVTGRNAAGDANNLSARARVSQQSRK